MRGEERVDLPAHKHLVEALFGRQMIDGHIGRRIEWRPVGPGHRPVHPADVVHHAASLDAEIVTQCALRPDAGVMAVAVQFADPAAGEIAGNWIPLVAFTKIEE